MVWAAFSFRGKTDVVFIDTNIGAVQYTELLAEHLLPFLEDAYPRGAVFQQDNAPAHSAMHTRDWFMENEVVTMDWPARSPDMNPIENAWDILARDVYAHQRQFCTVEDLKEAIKAAWDRIPAETFQNLAKSMTRRLISLVESRGRPTHY